VIDYCYRAITNFEDCSLNYLAHANPIKYTKAAKLCSGQSDEHNFSVFQLVMGLLIEKKEVNFEASSHLT